MSLQENLNIFRKIQTFFKTFFISFFISIQKKIKKIDKDSNEDIKRNFCITKFINNAKFITSSFLNLVDSLNLT